MVRSRAEYLLKKLISNTLSEKELDELLAGITNDETLKEYSPILEDYFNELIEKNDQEHQPEWRINTDNNSASARAFSTPRFRPNLKNYYRGIAAFIALLFGLGTAYYFLSDNSFNAPKYLTRSSRNLPHAVIPSNQENVPRGKRKSVRLSDGSVIKLNSDTKISFQDNFGKNGRAVSLKGEAFFDVERNESKPFIISLDKIKISVLGTSFNVKNYDDEQDLEVTVRSGRVSVSLDPESSNPIILGKDQKLIFNKSSQELKVIGVNAEQENSWITGSLKFNNTPLRQVKQTLEKWYDVNIIVEDSSLYDASLTGSHLNESLDSMLESITYAIDAQYEIKNRTVILRN